MDFLVFSDSHGKMNNICEAFSRQVRRPDAIMFLGDGIRDVSYCEFGDIPVYSVGGNCDSLYLSAGLCKSEMIITLGGKRILLTHGHACSVKHGLAGLVAEARKKEIDIALFGHTHEPLAKQLPAGETEYGVILDKPLYLMNPGSIGDYSSPSFGCITVDREGRVLMSHGNL